MKNYFVYNLTVIIFYRLGFTVEHACHVTMAVDKLMKRIVNPNIDVDGDDGNVASHLYDYTHGINSDPLTLFAITFSALIHDVDHRGVSNVQLAKEDEEMAAQYQNKSIAEQNSLDIAWDLLMEPEYDELRSYLFFTNKDMMRFRQVIVNVVLATDIFDKVGRYLHCSWSISPFPSQFT
jgi:3'5'-cyclic nucleotide phosphodiesterase